jgi:histidine triad (HIT) family protein
MPEDCIFCRIAKHEAPAHVLWEDETAMAFLDNRPLSKGHTLVIPKTHASKLTELPREQYGAILAAVCETCRRIERLTDHFNVGANQGSLAGQVVFHIHFHIIPRYPNDVGFPVKRRKLDDEEAKKLVEVLSPLGP